MSLAQAEKRLIAAKVKHNEVSTAYDIIGKKYTAIAQDYFRATSELHEAKRDYELAQTMPGNNTVLKPPTCHTDDDEQAASLEKVKNDSPAQPTARRGKRKIGDTECSTAPSPPTKSRDAWRKAPVIKEIVTVKLNPAKHQTEATTAENPGHKMIAAATFENSMKNNVSQPHLLRTKRKRRAVRRISTSSTPSAAHLDGSCKALGYTDRATYLPYPVKTREKSAERLGKRVRSPKKRFPCECA